MPLFDWIRSDLHSLNLDWIISKIKTVEESEQGAVDAAADANASKTAAAASATAANNSKTAAAGSATAAAGSAAQAQALVDQLDTTIAQDVSDWLDEHITPTTPAVDDTLTVSGAAADAAVTGDKITELKTKITLISDQNNLFDPLTITADKRLDAAGRTTTANGYYTSAFIPVVAGQYYEKNSPVNDRYHRMAVYSSASETAMISGQLFEENIVKIHADGRYIRICGLSAEVATAKVKLASAYDYVARKTAEDALEALPNIEVKTSQIDGMLPTGRTVTSSNLFSKASLVASGKYVGAITNGKAVLYDNANLDTYIIPVDGNSVYTFTDCRTAVVVSDLEYTAVSALLSYATSIDSTDGSYILFSFNPVTYPVSTYTITKPVPQYMIPNDWDVSHVSDAKLNSLLGGVGVRDKHASLSGGSSVTITAFPAYLKKNMFVSFYGKFSSFSGLLIGKGHNSYRGDWVEITQSDVIFHHYENNTDNIMQTDQHGLTVSDYIMVMLFLDADGKLNCSINTKSGTYTTYRQTNYDVFSGNTFATPTGAMTDVELSVSNGETKNPVWCLGDSYLGLNDQRVVGQLKNLGFWDGILFDGLAGLNSQLAYAELNRLLAFGMPKMLVWYLGMNDSNADYLTYMNLVKNICNANNIILILNKVPTTPTMDKETIGSYVEASGCRYINSYLAVGTDSSGSWYTGYLSSDNVHPTALGAKALAMRMIVDVPELAEYGYKAD